MKKWSSLLVGWIFFCLLTGCATHRAKRDLIVLLPDPDGKGGAVTVTTRGGSQILDKLGYATEVEDVNKPLLTPRPVSENEIKDVFGPALSAQPDPADRFISIILYFEHDTAKLTQESKNLLQEVLKTIKNGISRQSRCMIGLKSKKTIIRRDPKNRRRVLFYGIFFSVFLFLLSLFKPTFFDFLNSRVYDTLLSANLGQPSPVPVIVDIDEKSLQQYGQWPWPRYRIAILLDKLRGLGALSIGLDMMFAEDDRTSLVAIRKELLHDFGVDLGFGEVPQDLWDSDKRLADALSRGKVVLGYQFLFEEDSDSDNCLLHSKKCPTHH